MIRSIIPALLFLSMAMAMAPSKSDPVVDAKPSPQSLFASWTGSDAQRSFGKSSFLFTGTAKGEYELNLRSEFNSLMPWRFRASLSRKDSSGETQIIGSDGSVTWNFLEKTTGDGAREIRDPKLVKSSMAIANQLLFNPMSLFDIQKKMSKLNTVGKVEFADSICWRVIGMPRAEKSPVNFFFDWDSGRFKGLNFKATGDDGPRMMEIVIPEYRSFPDAEGGSLDFPARMDLMQEGQVVFSLSVDSLSRVMKLTMDEFKLPDVIRQLVSPSPPMTVGSKGQNKRLISMIGPSLVGASGEMVSSEVLKDKANVLLYFSAKWCPPCRKFTPTLVKFFDDHAKAKDFTIVFVSSDRSDTDQMKYMKDYGMDFYAVPLTRVNGSGLKQTYGDRGIPNLVWLNPEGVAVAKSYVDGNYVGPNKVLAEFARSMSLN